MQALAMLSTGAPIGYVSKQTGLPYFTIKDWQRRYRTSDVARNHKQFTQVTVERTVARALADDGKATREKLAATVKRSAETLADAKLATVREVAEVAPVVQSLVSSAKILHQWDRDGQDGILALGSYLETVDEVDEAGGVVLDVVPDAISEAEPSERAEAVPDAQGALYSKSPADADGVETQDQNAKPETLSTIPQANVEAGDGASVLPDVGL